VTTKKQTKAADNRTPPPSQPDRKRRPGAPDGNQNRTVAGVRRAKKRTRPVNEDSYDRQGRRYAKGVFKYYSKPNDPRRGTLGDIESGLRRTRSRCDLRGWFDSSGEQKEAARQYYVLLDRKDRQLKDLEDERLRAAGRGVCANCGGELTEPDVIRTASFSDGSPYIACSGSYPESVEVESEGEASPGEEIAQPEPTQPVADEAVGVARTEGAGARL